MREESAHNPDLIGEVRAVDSEVDSAVDFIPYQYTTRALS
jgi:hypothetical protein